MLKIILQHLVIYFESTCSTFAKIGYFSLQISGTFSGMSGKSQIFAGNPHMVQTSRKIINISIKIDTNVAPTTDTVATIFCSCCRQQIEGLVVSSRYTA